MNAQSIEVKASLFWAFFYSAVEVAMRTVVMSARIDPATDRATRILAALRGVNRQEVVKAALVRELEQAPELQTVKRLVAEFPATEVRSEAS